MIGSFWNLCRACPSMPVDKLHSEYRSTYRWHEYTGPRQEVVRKAPQSTAATAANDIMNDVSHTMKPREENVHSDSSELEPLVDEKNYKEDKHEDFNTEYKKKFRPFSELYSEGKFSGNKRVIPTNKDEVDCPGSSLVNGDPSNDSWYKEVVELRKKAVEYRSRGWGSDFANEKIDDIYHKQLELWDQVSRRSSLSALSLASVPHKNYTKREKDEDNNKKSSPTKAERNAENSARLIRDIVRHHLERTTGGSELDGLILSPTREKLEPTIPRRDDDSRGSTKNSPKKISPIKSSSLKRNHQRSSKSPRNVRSQSVGPTTTESSGERKSPKRQSRSATVKERKSSSNSANRRPRPSEPQKSETTNEREKNEVTAIDKEEIIYNAEPVVKSPPEPTRVKSPEQILMKSPDPVNWTVPLDTGKTFTVTQNIRDDDIGSRPHSEVKVWTPSDAPLAAAQSAPPSLVDIERTHEMS